MDIPTNHIKGDCPDEDYDRDEYLDYIMQKVEEE